MRGPLQVAALARSLGEVVRRHEALRTVFVAEGGLGRQAVCPPAPVRLPVVDLAALRPQRGGPALAALLAAQGGRPFDLERGPLLRVLLLRLGPADHVLALNLHHIVADGWSLGILAREISAAYGALACGLAPDLPALPVQVTDFAAWQRQRAAGEGFAPHLAYWRERLAGAPAALELPTDRPRRPVQTYRGAWCALDLDADLAGALGSLALGNQATLFMTLLAAFAVLLGRLSGQRDLVVGAPIAGRDDGAIEGLIGLFLNSLALRTDLGGNPSFGELLSRVRAAALDAYRHQEVPFEQVLAELRPTRDLARTPVFQVFFNMLTFPAPRLELPGLAVELLSPPAELPSKFDLTVYVERREQIHCRLVYNADLFDAGRIAELLRQFRQLLAAFAAHPEARIEEVSLVTPEARAVLPDPCSELDAAWLEPVHELFRRHAASQPLALAVSSSQGAITYAELDAESSRLANYLRGGGIARGDVVAIHSRRRASLVVAVLAVLKAGAAFVILDPAYPAPRLVECLEIADPKGWLELEAAGDLPPELARFVEQRRWCRCVRRDQAAAGPPPWAPWPAAAPAVELDADDLAYIAFTSGSTGVPKGVMGRHGPLSHFIPWQQRRFGLDRGDRFSMLSGISHDPLHRDIFTPLQIGAALCIPDAADVTSGRIGEWLGRERITVAHLTPAMGQVIAQSRPGLRLPELRYAFLVGDALTRRDVARLRRLAPALTCVNFYGSTETQRAVGYHVAGAAADLDDGDDLGRQVLPLGRGIADVQLLVHNAAGRLAGIGEVGEVALRSPHLARGYSNDAQLSAERFVVNSATGRAGDRLYRTGDLGRYLPDGEVCFLGRADQQLKIRGFRVEPGEIEAVLGRHPQIEEAAVVAWLDGTGERALAAYLVPAAGGGAGLDTGEVRAYLAERLPAYMLPATLLVLDRLPLTPNGKLDRRALPDPRTARPSGDDFVAPGPGLETLVAGIWQEVLGIERIGLADNFFDLGGHSLRLLEMHHRLQQRLAREVPVVDLFRFPTVGALAAELSRTAAGAPAGTAAADARLRAAQERAARKRQAPGLAGAARRKELAGG